MRWRNLITYDDGKADVLYYVSRADMRAAAKFYRTMADNVKSVKQIDSESN